MLKMRIAIFLFFVYVTTAVQATLFNKCSDGPEPLKLDIIGCDKPPCSFVKGRDVRFNVDLLINDNITTLTTKVKALAMGTETVYPLPQSNACLSLTNGECPLDEGEEVTYTLGMPILSAYPTVPVIIEFSLISEKSIVACFKLSAAIVDP